MTLFWQARSPRNGSAALSAVATSNPGASGQQQGFGLAGLSLKARLALLIAGAVLPLSAAGFAATYLLFEANRQTASARLLQSARTVFDNIETRVQSVVSAAQVLALADELQSDDFEIFRTKADLFLATHLPNSTVVVTDRGGRQRVNTAVALGGTFPERAPSGASSVHEKVFVTGLPAISDLFFAPVLKRYVVTVNVPVKRDGKVIHNLGMPFFADDLSAALAHSAKDTDWLIALFDRNGTVIARSRDGSAYIARQASPTLFPALMQNRDQVLTTTTFDGVRVLTAVTYSELFGWRLAVGVPEVSVLAPLNQAVLLIACFGAASLIIGLWAATRLAQQVLNENRERDLLMHELNHRVKNTLATVLAIVGQTLTRSRDADQAKQELEGRLVALAGAHDILTEETWAGSFLHRLIDSCLKPYRDLPSSIAVSGAEAFLTPKQTVALSLVIQELATNAAKYGALSKSGSRISIKWSVNSEEVDLHWREENGPLVNQPQRRGFGTELIERSVAFDLKGKVIFDFLPNGLHCVIRFPLQNARRYPNV